MLVIIILGITMLAAQTNTNDIDDYFDTMHDRAYTAYDRDSGWAVGLSLGLSGGIFYPFDDDAIAGGYDIALRVINFHNRFDVFSAFFMQFSLCYRSLEASNGNTYELFEFPNIQLGVQWPRNLELWFLTAAVVTAVEFVYYTPWFDDAAGNELPFVDSFGFKIPIGIETYAVEESFSISVYAAPSLFRFAEDTGAVELDEEYVFTIDAGFALWAYFD